MSGGGHAPPPIPASNGGEFLLSLLQKPQSQHQSHQNQNHHQHHHRQSLPIDPAVAAVGPSLPFPRPPAQQQPADVQDLLRPLPLSSAGNGRFLGFPHSYFPSQFQGNHQLGFSNSNSNSNSNNSNSSVQSIVHQNHLVEHKLKFGSLPSEIVVVSEGLPMRADPPPDRSWLLSSNSSAPPPGFPSRPRGGNSDQEWNRSKGIGYDAERERDFAGQDAGSVRVGGTGGLGLAAQLDHPGVPPGSNLRSVPASDVEDSMMKLETEAVGVGQGKDHEIDDIGRRIVDSLLIDDDLEEKSEKKYHRDKDFRSDSRGKWMLSQRRRIEKRGMRCRSDINRLNEVFCAIVNSLIPPEEEKTKQQQLLALLERLIAKEWPNAQLYLYGSCANSFGVSKSDVDLCLAMEEPDVNKAEVLLKLADILQSDSLQNVQALTRARVPIVKLLDPATEISCDICINNVLAVVNTRLLRDYAQIDVRLRQLAYIVKHWAKSRAVNETYQGTLSSYAYVLMCIHFLQLRRPAILPCLQGMEPTYSVTVDNIECAYFDQVEKLQNFGAHNRETIAQLVWGFFRYWAYVHDYTDSVISVRTGSIMSKRDKDWTRRVGNDRHLICIEDPFEISHDLGRVVDKNSIRVLREEFERAAEIMQYDPNPCVRLFERYIPS